MTAWLATLAGLALAAQSAPDLTDLGWMAGQWQTRSGARWTEETWSAPRGGIMLGFSRTGDGTALREWEFIMIAPGADGALAYHAQPGGRPPIAFRLVAHDGMSATFENSAHDFPQRIRYVRERDRMTATISAIDGTNAMSWTYRRQ